MAEDTFALLDQVRDTGGRAVMATLVRTHGTTPRREGTKMFVGEDGQLFGSVTIGGCVDVRVIEEAASVLAGASPRLLQLQLGDEDAWEIGLTCGGTVDVFVEPVTVELLAAYDAARTAWNEGRDTVIATTLLGESAGARELLDGAVADEDRYVEILHPPAALLIFGGSAVAISLVQLAKALGFRTVVVDARPRFANRERFPLAGDVRVGIASEIASELRIDATTAVVLVVHDYKVEVPVLQRVLQTAAPYIGLLGSRRRGAAVLQMLRESGVSDESLARIRNPAGLDLGGDSPAEIALSIIAEVVAAMHGRAGAALSAR